MQNLLALAPMIRQTGGFLMSAGGGQAGMVSTPVTSPPRLTGPSLITYTDIAERHATCRL